MNAADRHPTDLGLDAAVPDDAPQRKGRDDLHGRQEERGEPGSPIGCAVHVIRQHLELFQVLVLASQRLDHAHPGDVLVVSAGDLGVGAPRSAELYQDALAELHCDDHQDRDSRQHDQAQLPVDDQHEDGGSRDVHGRPGDIHHAPGDQLRHAPGIRSDARHQASHGGLRVVRERQFLQVVEQHFAQVVLHALAQHAGQVNEREHHASLHYDEPAVQDRQTGERIHILERDALVDDLLVDEREVRIGDRGQRDGDEESKHPAPVRFEQTHNAPEHRAGQLAGVFFFFEFDKFVRHNSSPYFALRGIGTM